MNNQTANILHRINRSLPYLFFGALICMGIGYWIMQYRLKQHYVLTVGTVLEYNINSRGPGGTVKYAYKVKGKLYYSSNPYPEIHRSGKDSIVGKQFPVAYDTADVDNSRILITTKRFKEFSIPFPDSLLWIEDYETDW
ncbi:hypothetical protein SAMN04488128_1011541 [Chitinophaga eiseniae]|uniref:DUF3592 domain-containing protein n=1 Tax=Chitinophaga eiseniae TaxID=634771 RepID=A0A1T4ND76_9BACT|nr:hypothetical protein [Chitinophaga eiseniae]SJZ77281.1 hypothetical protein SAMN04488128_1011541 [Chitinophaga eiseniae]